MALKELPSLSMLSHRSKSSSELEKEIKLKPHFRDGHGNTQLAAAIFKSSAGQTEL